MNIIEQNYADYLLPKTPQEVAQSWDRILTHVPVDFQEIDYHNMLQNLTIADQGESVYLVFSHLFDMIEEPLHVVYENEFIQINYTLDGLCKRKKAPSK